MSTATLPLPADTARQGVVIAGRLDNPTFAKAASGFMDTMCGGPVKLGPPAPRRSYDWSVSKEENQRRAMAEIDAAFARGGAK